MSGPVLNHQWLTENPLDAEQKQYLLLAYIKYIQEKFSGEMLFPHLSHLIEHIRNLDHISNGFKSLENDFPRVLSGFNANATGLVFSPKNPEESVFSFVSELIDFAKPRLSYTASVGKEIFDEVENSLSIESIGILPVLQNEGYFLLAIDGLPKVNVFRYSVSSLSLDSEKYRSISMQWVMNDTLSLGNSPQHIKLALIRRFPELPNPAAFVCTSFKAWPMKETLLPVTRRILLKRLSPGTNPQS
jgi:hypothetical protein